MDRDEPLDTEGVLEAMKAYMEYTRSDQYQKDYWEAMSNRKIIVSQKQYDAFKRLLDEEK